MSWFSNVVTSLLPDKKIVKAATGMTDSQISKTVSSQLPNMAKTVVIGTATVATAGLASPLTVPAAIGAVGKVVNTGMAINPSTGFPSLNLPEQNLKMPLPEPQKPDYTDYYIVGGVMVVLVVLIIIFSIK